MSASESASDVTEDQENPGLQQEDWEDWQDDGESQGLKSLFTDARFAGLEEVLAHDQQERGFSLPQYRSQVRWLLVAGVHAMHAAIGAATRPAPATPH
jgi:hypothetical protein